MHIKLSPVRMDKTLTALKAGDKLTLNGVEYDFASLPVGATLPAEAITSEWISGPVERTSDGQLHLTLLLPHGDNAPASVRFPTPLNNPADGWLPLPQPPAGEPT